MGKRRDVDPSEVLAAIEQVRAEKKERLAARKAKREFWDARWFARCRELEKQARLSSGPRPPPSAKARAFMFAGAMGTLSTEEARKRYVQAQLEEYRLRKKHPEIARPAKA